MIYFLLTTLFKLVASFFWKKVADAFRRPSVLIETPANSTLTPLKKNKEKNNSLNQDFILGLPWDNKS